MKSDALYALLRRRGILWPSAEIYGGTQGLYDYGPLGHALKRRVEDAWSAWFVGLSPDYYRIEPAEILPEAVVRASGHLENFTDPQVTCKACHHSFRADTVLEKWLPDGIDGLSAEQIGAQLAAHQPKCPNCGQAALELPTSFNLMFPVQLGATGEERGYLAPETAQASYLAFSRMWDVGRRALPLGIAVVGKAYRNEIAPRQVLHRLRVFTQAELQIFFDPRSPPMPAGIDLAREGLPMLRVARRESGASEPESITGAELVASGDFPEFYVRHLVHLLRFFRDVLGYPADRIRLLEKSAKERAFYNRLHVDVEVKLDSLGGYKELGAAHYRGDYDLARHSAGAGRDLAVTVSDGSRVLPHVLELTFGVDRNLWALADLHVHVDGERTVWALPPYLAPTSVGVFPLLRKEHGPYASELAARLATDGVVAALDEAGSIGKRYAREDEAGTPFCITVDGETLDAGSPNSGTVTLRDRDSRAQERVPVSQLAVRIGSRVRPPRPIFA